MKEAITVVELTKCLNKFPADMAVFAAWEGLFVPIKEEDIAINQPAKPKSGDVLIIHVDYC